MEDHSNLGDEILEGLNRLEDDYTSVDIPLESSLEAVEKFLSSPVWRDIKTTLEGSIELSMKALEFSGDFEEIKFEQGKIQQARIILELPHSMKETLEVAQESEKLKEEGEQDAEDQE